MNFSDNPTATIHATDQAQDLVERALAELNFKVKFRGDTARIGNLDRRAVNELAALIQTHARGSFQVEVDEFDIYVRRAGEGRREAPPREPTPPPYEARPRGRERREAPPPPPPPSPGDPFRKQTWRPGDTPPPRRRARPFSERQGSSYSPGTAPPRPRARQAPSPERHYDGFLVVNINAAPTAATFLINWARDLLVQAGAHVEVLSWGVLGFDHVNPEALFQLLQRQGGVEGVAVRFKEVRVPPLGVSGLARPWGTWEGILDDMRAPPPRSRAARTPDSDVIARLKQLLRLANHPASNVHEAALARSRAVEMMREHKITEADIPDIWRNNPWLSSYEDNY